MSASLKPRTKTAKPIYYPDTDGKPMGESDLHRGLMFHIIHLLQRFFAGQQVYVTGNLLLYYEEGNPRKVIVPDCFVVWGVEPHPRLIYKLWEEAHGPKVVFEVTSKSTRRNDVGPKMQLYAKLGIEEYFLYDPTSDYLNPPLAAYRLKDGAFAPMQPDSMTGDLDDFEIGPAAGPSPVYTSQHLGMRLYLDEDNQLQFFDIANGVRVLSDEEARAQAEEARREAEEARWYAETERQRAEEEVRRLRAELERLQAGAGSDHQNGA